MRSVVGALLLSLALGCGARETVHRGPNVLLLSIDTLRADHLGLYGYERPTSPRLDRFAEGSVVFEDCQASASWTLPGMASVFTSTHTSTHACWGLGSRLDDSFTTLTEVLLAAGYDTACVVSHLFCTTRHGLQQGFVHFDDAYAFPEVDPALATTSDVITDRGLAYLEARAGAGDGRPWFLWLHYFDPHDEYLVQEGFTERFLAEGATGPEEVVARYDGEIAFTDHHVGRLLDGLDAGPFADDTVVVVVADHGEEFYDHGGVGHGATLFSEQLRVPFLLRAPELAPARVERRVRTVDLLPTVLDLAGLPAPPAAVGESLLPLLEGPAAPAPPHLAETRMSPLAPLEAVIVGDLKLVRAPDGSSPMLFDLAADPAETRDLAAQRPADVERLTRELERLTAEARALGEGFERSGEQALPPGIVEQLQGLGYGGESE